MTEIELEIIYAWVCIAFFIGLVIKMHYDDENLR